MFTKMGCNAAAISEMLGNAGVTEHNMMTYLGIIEQRTNELLQMYRSSQAPETLAPVIGPVTPAGKGAMTLPTLPSTGMRLLYQYC